MSPYNYTGGVTAVSRHAQPSMKHLLQAYLDTATPLKNYTQIFVLTHLQGRIEVYPCPPFHIIATSSPRPYLSFVQV